MRKASKIVVCFAMLVLLVGAIGMAMKASPALADSGVTVPVVNADGGIYWRAMPDWNTAIQISGHGVYTSDVVVLECYKRGGTVPPYYNNPLWYQARVISGVGQGQGWLNDHFLDTDTNLPNIPVAGVPTCTTAVNDLNWTGYAAAGKLFSNVQASWQVTLVHCQPNEKSSAYAWVGLGGTDPGAPLEQIGTAEGCRGGQPFYLSWYEAPDGIADSVPTVINSLSVGDVVRASVQYNGNGNFTMTLAVNNCSPFIQTMTNPDIPSNRDTADIIVEKDEPYFSSFEPITFAQISADGQPITSAPQMQIMTAQVPEVDIISPLTPDGTSFTATWLRSS
jgi:hypothetical protein